MVDGITLVEAMMGMRTMTREKMRKEVVVEVGVGPVIRLLGPVGRSWVHE